MYQSGVIRPVIYEENQNIGNIVKDNNSIIAWVRYCVTENGKTVLSRDQEGTLYSNVFRVGYFGDGQNDTSSNARGFFGNEIALVNLSNSVLSDRLNWQSQSDDAYFSWSIGTWLTISIGMLTTIFVSLSSTEFGRGDGRTQRVIRTLAIVLPALGTAVAAMIGFYGPQAQWSLASRASASLAQLQDQIAIDIWKKHCIGAQGDQNDQALATSFESWAKRYVDIETISLAGSASAAQSGGEAPNAEKNGGQQGSGSVQPAAAPGSAR